MNSFKLKIADHVLEICTTFRASSKNLIGYLSNETPEKRIVIGEDGVLDREGIYGTDSELLGWKGSVDTSSLLQKVANELLDFDTILMHGAAIGLNDRAYVFTAPSGTGKTTHIHKWKENCEDAIIINDDLPFIKISDTESPFVCGSPWAGKENLHTNVMVPLKAIVILERNEDNSICRISFAEAFPSLLSQIHRPDDEIKMRKTLKLLKKLDTSVSFWRFRCNNFKADSFDVAYSALVNDRV